MSIFNIGDVVRIDDIGYPGLYEISGQCDAAKNPDVFDYDYYVTNDECESEMPVKASDLILVCRRELRCDISDEEDGDSVSNDESILDYFDDTDECPACGSYYCTCCGCDCMTDYGGDEEEDD